MNILIIEDSNSVAHIISSILTSYEYRASRVSADDFDAQLLKDSRFSVFILNVNLSRNRSPVLLRMIKRRAPGAYVVGVSTKATWKEKVEFLNSGGDDVLDYPFPVQELLARIQSLLRRPKNEAGGIIRFKNLEIDTNMKEVAVDNKSVPLRRREYTLLEYLVRNRGRTITRAELLDHVWDYRKITGSNTVDVHVKRLRDKLRDRDFIETVHGFGYTVRKKKKKKENLLQEPKAS